MNYKNRYLILDNNLLAGFDGKQFKTILIDPPWQCKNRTGKNGPEHDSLARYETMEITEIMELPVSELCGDNAHIYLRVPNALLAASGLIVMFHINQIPIHYESLPTWYINYYFCPYCKLEWQDKCDCECNDKCPNCNEEIEPFKSYLLDS